ncbi:uncharacterized protein TRAVEDRAFT_46319 [Trametes versicolor FP-101664 SS1]|uniref:uncharacterized protein n=1 Tax=Trametes versicolor (strain FP-101664) TaxID=717944 RepID=UPI0004623E3D|nr:uncharacterized protein TRAVEDRAFT_46319 [Trametes versicolor FP-101664 SS1]EIW61096.1 hypothetical protein TRAVEDRAFT_46319 [Trametes versicolor FP-101664 SS1]
MSHIRALCPPPEILLEIGRFTGPPGLAVLLLANKWLNEFLSPLLYSAVVLKEPRSTHMWLRTLLTSQNELFGARDLVGLVRSLHVSDVLSKFSIAHFFEDKIKAGISQVLPRLTSLRELCFRSPRVLTIDVLVDFLHMSRGNISSIDVVLAENEQGRIPFEEERRFKRTLQPLGNLTLLRINHFHHFPLACTDFLQRLLTAHSNQICTLSLSDSDERISRRIIGTAPRFPMLIDLDLDVTVFFLRKFPHKAFPRVQTLTLRGGEDVLNFDIREKGRLPPSAYPLLGKISCEDPFLHVFLPAGAGPHGRRPIHTIQLNDASWEADGDYDGIAGDWWSVADSLKSLRFSGTPVRHLSFCSDDIQLAQLASLSECLISLETLVIATVRGPALDCDSSVEHLLAKMPRLHTLLFSDAPSRTNNMLQYSPVGRSRTKQCEIVTRWSQRGVSLRRIAFTVMMEWVRGAEGWELRDYSDEYEIVTDSDTFGDDSGDDGLEYDRGVEDDGSE